MSADFDLPGRVVLVARGTADRGHRAHSLASDAASFVTGTVLTADGGSTAP